MGGEGVVNGQAQMQAPKLQLFNTVIDDAFQTQRGSVFYFFVCDIMWVAGMVVFRNRESISSQW